MSPPRRRVLWGGMALVVVVLLLVDRLSQPDAFAVRRVSFEGEFSYVDPKVLRAAVLPHVQGNYFTLDLARVESAARAVPWVDGASVRREWPLAVHISYTEYQLVARWASDQWLNAHGEIVAAPGFADPGTLPRLAGPAGAHTRVLEKFRALAPYLNGAGLRIISLRVDSRGAWQAQVVGSGETTPMTLRLGRRAVMARARRFARVYPNLVVRRDAVDYVDLRYPNGFALARRAAPVRKAARSKEAG